MGGWLAGYAAGGLGEETVEFVETGGAVTFCEGGQSGWAEVVSILAIVRDSVWGSF